LIVVADVTQGNQIVGRIGTTTDMRL